jgi:NADH-ubiquinone oxidoreductase chain 2
MITRRLFSLITVVALPTIKISPLFLIRRTSLVLLGGSIISYNRIHPEVIESGLGTLSGLIEVTPVSESRDRLICRTGRRIILRWRPVKINKEVNKNQIRLKTELRNISEYSLIILFTTCGASLLISSRDLISIYLSIELQSFAVYILAALYRDSESATSAGLKYFLLGGLSSGLILLGSGLIYAYTGLTNFESIFSLLSVNGINNLTDDLGPCVIGLRIIVIGFLFKIAAAPFHNWAPDVYDGTPTIVTTWLTIIPKISIFVLLLELQIGLRNNRRTYSVISNLNDRTFSIDVFKNLLLTSALLSLIIGTVVGLAQYRIKRLFAYSTISHVGFLLLALGINSEESIESFLLLS